MTTPDPIPAHSRTAPCAPGGHELHDQPSGFILVGVVMFMLALTILGLSLFSLSSYEGQFFYASVSREQSLHSSESGLEVVKALLTAPGSRLEDAQLAVGQFGITRSLAYQKRSSNPNDTTSRGPVNWDSTLVIVVSARAGNEVRAVESRFVPMVANNPYRNLVTCGLGFTYDNTNGGVRTAEMAGRVWQQVRSAADSAWTAAVNWTSGRPLDITTPPRPLADAFVAAKLPGAYDPGDLNLSSSGGPNDYFPLSLNTSSATPRFATLHTPQEVMDNSLDPERNWYGCFFDERVMIRVKGTWVLVLPDGACFEREVTIEPDGNGATGTLVIVARANGDDPRGIRGPNRAIWFQGGLIHVNPAIKVFLVSEDDVLLGHEHDFDPGSSHESKAVSVMCGGSFELMGPKAGSVFKIAYGGTAQESIADDLLSRGALPAIVGGRGNSLEFAKATWKETRLP